MPMDPVSIDASSVRMSPNRFSVTTTSNSDGVLIRRMAQASTSMCSYVTVGCSAATRSTTSRHRTEELSTLALSTEVTFRSRSSAISKAARTTRSISSSV